MGRIRPERETKLSLRREIMALVNHKKKFIFFHLYKCGGKSLRKVLNEEINGSEELQGVHSLPRDMRFHFEKNLSLKKYDSYYKFTIIRNPFDFLVSTYFYAKKHKNHFMHIEIERRNMTMEEFIPYYMNLRIQHFKVAPIGRPFGSNKVVTLMDWITDTNGDEIVDFIGKLEDIDKDQKIIFEKLGLPSQVIPVLDKSQIRENDYRQYYTDKSREMVEKYFAKDLKRFNYEF